MNKVWDAQQRRARGEGGFTLIEMMVVVMIIGILLAIGVPTFLGARSRAQDKQAQSNARSGMIAAQAVNIDDPFFATIADNAGLQTELRASEPALNWIGYAAAVSPDQIGSYVVYQGNSTPAPGGGSYARVGLATRSASGRCYGVAVMGDGTVQYSSWTAWACHPYYAAFAAQWVAGGSYTNIFTIGW